MVRPSKQFTINFAPGSVEDLYREGRPKKLEAASQCIAKIEQRPSVLLRKLANQTGVSHMSAQRYLHAEGLKPYKIQHVQELHDDDYACLLYTSPSPRDGLLSRMPSSA